MKAPLVRLLSFLSCFVLLASASHAASKGKSGTLTGKITVTAPARPAPPRPASEGAYGHESVGGPGQAVAHSLPEEVVLYLEGVKGKFPAPKKHVKLDQQYLQFTTRVLPVLKGTTVDFTNHDRVYHNVFTNSQDNKFDLGKKKNGETASVQLLKAEVPVKVYCEIHSAMKAYILVLPNPYFTKAGPGQTFHISGIPAGKYKLVAWHDYWAPVEQMVTIKKGKTTEVEVTLDKAQN